MAPLLLRLDRVRIALLGSIDLGVGRLVLAGIAVLEVRAVRISRLPGLDLGVRGVGSALLPGLVNRAVRVAPLRLVELGLVRMLLLLRALLLLRRRRLRVRRLRCCFIGRGGFRARGGGSGDAEREACDERENQFRGHGGTPSGSSSWDDRTPMTG